MIGETHEGTSCVPCMVSNKIPSVVSMDMETAERLRTAGLLRLSTPDQTTVVSFPEVAVTFPTIATETCIITPNNRLLPLGTIITMNVGTMSTRRPFLSHTTRAGMVLTMRTAAVTLCMPNMTAVGTATWLRGLLSVPT